MTSRPDLRSRSLAVGGIIGPVAFVTAWAVGGLQRDAYSPLDDPISRLAEIGASTRLSMTSGFVVFAFGVGSYALALRRYLPGPAWMAAAATALATLGVAATPLGAGVDTAHGVAAAAGYVALSATPLLATPAIWRAGRRRAAAMSVVVGVLAAASLAGTVVLESRGLWQRTGLTIADAWIVASAVAMVRPSGADHHLP